MAADTLVANGHLPATALRPRPRRGARTKPTREFIEQLESDLTAHFRPQDDEIDQLRALRDQTATVEIPKRMRRVDGFEMRDTAVGDEIRRIVSSVNSRPFRCVVVPSDPQSDTGQANASLTSDGVLACDLVA